MDYKIFNLKIDLGRESRNAVKPVQGESAVKLRATLTHNSQPYNLTDTTVRCLFRKPDHTYSYIDAVVIDAAKGIVEIELTNQVLLLSGSVVAAIEVAGTIGIAKTWLFTMDVQPGIPYTDIESVDEFPAVEQMIVDIAEIKANFNAIVAGVTVDGEVILARAGFTTLGERIDDLATKVNTTLPAQLADIVKRPINLFSLKNIVFGYSLSSTNNELVVSSAYSVSDFIEIKPNTEYTVKTIGAGRFNYYNSDKNFIASYGVGSAVGVLTRTSQNNAKYVRIATLSTNLYATQINEGPVALAYDFPVKTFNENIKYPTVPGTVTFIYEEGMIKEVREIDIDGALRKTLLSYVDSRVSSVREEYLGKILVTSFIYENEILKSINTLEEV